MVRTCPEKNNDETGGIKGKSGKGRPKKKRVDVIGGYMRARIRLRIGSGGVEIYE